MNLIATYADQKFNRDVQFRIHRYFEGNLGALLYYEETNPTSAKRKSRQSRGSSERRSTSLRVRTRTHIHTRLYRCPSIRYGLPKNIRNSKVRVSRVIIVSATTICEGEIGGRKGGRKRGRKQEKQERKKGRKERGKDVT